MFTYLYSRTSFQKENCVDIDSLFRMTRCPSVYGWKNFLQFFPFMEQWTTSRSSRYLYLIFLPSSQPARAGYIVLVMNMTNVAVNWLERGRGLGPVLASKLNINRSHADNGSAYQFASSIISHESITQTINRKSETVFLFSYFHPLCMAACCPIAFLGWWCHLRLLPASTSILGKNFESRDGGTLSNFMQILIQLK